jgi:pyruvoyl-dependent arginine decarboxylase (PvlArgDC)
MDLDDSCQKESRTILDCLSPRGGTVLAAVIADIIADGLNSTEIAAIGGFITIIGDSLGYIAAQMELNEQIAGRNT